MNYSSYKMSKKEMLKYGFGYLGIFLLIGKLFYNSFAVGLLGILAIPFLLKRKSMQLAKVRKQKLLLQFRDFILSYSSALKAGYSVENGFIEAYKDLQFMYDQEADILTECRFMIRQMKNNMILENLLQDFAKRASIQDIQDFTSIFAIARRSGGNLNKIIQNTASIISEKIETKEDIQILLSAKKLEQSIMDVIPIAIMLYISFASPGYFTSLYGNIVGILVMSICLIIYLGALFIAEKIIQIEV